MNRLTEKSENHLYDRNRQISHSSSLGTKDAEIVAESSVPEAVTNYYHQYAAWKNKEITYQDFIDSLPLPGTYMGNKQQFETYHAEMQKARAQMVTRESTIEVLRKSPKTGKDERQSKYESKPADKPFTPQLGTPDEGRRSIKRSAPTPIIIALMITGFLFYSNLDSPFSINGNVLISVSIGCHIAAIFWLELATMPRYRKSLGLTWSFFPWLGLIGTSAVCTAVMLFLRSADIGTSSEIPFSLLIEDPNPTGFSLHPMLHTFLVYQLISHIFLSSTMYASTHKRSKAASTKFIRSPWSIVSVSSLVFLSLLLGLPGPVLDIIQLPDPSIWADDALMATYGAIVVACAAQLYGSLGRAGSSMMNQLMLGIMIPLLSGIALIYSEGTALDYSNNSFLIFIAPPIIVNALIVFAPENSTELSTALGQDRKEHEGDNGKPHSFLWLNFLAFLVVIAFIGILAFKSNTHFIPVIPALFSYTIFTREHSRKVGGDVIRIRQILDRKPTTARSRKRKTVYLKFSVLGQVASGKTSFSSALWTLINNPEMRNIWWSKRRALQYKDHRSLQLCEAAENSHDESHGSHPGDMLALAQKGAGARRKDYSVLNMFGERIAIKTCEDHIVQRKFPNPRSTRDFPISAMAFGANKLTLKKLSNGLTDHPNRSVPEPTRKAGRVNMNLIFDAEVETFEPSFLWKNSPFRRASREENVVQVKVETWDLMGESFQAAVNVASKEYNDLGELEGKLDRLLAMKLDSDILLEHERDHIDPEEVNRAMNLLLNSPHQFIIVDVENLVKHHGQHEIQEYLDLMWQFKQDKDTRLESVHFLLNKSDWLFKGDPSVKVDQWSHLRKSEVAESILDVETNSAFSKLKSSGQDVRASFVCTFGGTVPRRDEDGFHEYSAVGKIFKGKSAKDDAKSAYEEYRKTTDGRLDDDAKPRPLSIAPWPMLPVNVIEPLIDVILASRLHSEEIPE